MGFHVGVYAVQLAPLSRALHLSPVEIGAAGTVSALVGVIVRALLGRYTDRFGRHVILAIGFCGTALAFAAVAASPSIGVLFAALILYGLCACWMDIGANTLGSDLEQRTGTRAMNGLQAGFSGGACVGALLTALLLTVGVDFRLVYVGAAAVLMLCGVILAWMRIPSHTMTTPDVDTAGAPRNSLWRYPVIIFATVVLTATFFGDGALESFLSVYLNTTLGATIILAGLGVAFFHAASLFGRTIAQATLHRFGERRVVFVSGLVASAGVVVAVFSPTPWVAVVGLLLTGFAEAPLVPVALSLAGSAVPGRTGEAIALTTTVGFSAFIVSPLIVGGIAQATDLRVGLALVAFTLLVVAFLGLRWPRHQLR